MRKAGRLGVLTVLSMVDLAGAVFVENGQIVSTMNNQIYCSDSVISDLVVIHHGAKRRISGLEPTSREASQGAGDVRHRPVKRTRRYVSRPITKQIRCPVKPYILSGN